jgi:CheY-like chemotaxis protein
MQDIEPEGLRGRRIMVVEDEGLILLTIREILEELGCELAVAEARSGPAVAAVGRMRIDAALLDVNLGAQETSYPVAEALAARGIPFAFLTGYASEALSEGYRHRPVLAKPVDERRVAAILRELLRRGEPRAP